MLVEFLARVDIEEQHRPICIYEICIKITSRSSHSGKQNKCTMCNTVHSHSLKALHHKDDSSEYPAKI